MKQNHPSPQLGLSEEERLLLDAVKKRRKLAILNNARVSEEEMDYIFLGNDETLREE